MDPKTARDRDGTGCENGGEEFYHEAHPVLQDEGEAEIP